MALFQNSVLKKHLKLQDKTAVDKAYKKFTKYFHDTKRQQNIRESKEEQYQEGFLRELFVKILGYTLNPEPNFNLTTELKNEKNAKKTDGAILKNKQALAVIELKSTKTKDLESIRQQAFDYKANQTGCVYVITSNFEKVRFYINNAVDFEEFNLFTLTQPQFELLYLCLQKDNVLNNIPLTIKTDSVVEEEKITKTFYNDYSVFKRELFRDLVKLNMKNEVFRTELQKEDSERANKNIKQHLFKKSQKLIDRFLFIFFAEDRGLLPPNSTLRILQDWNKLKDLDTDIPLYKRFKLYFKYLDEGRKGTDKKAEIFAYNGGLFKPDPVLDSLLLTDELLYKHTKTLSDYDFESQVDVNILGHIFENSLNEIESVNAEIEGVAFDKQKTKRKKDGVFYTPKYITKYIVDNTIGKLCTEKKTELSIIEADFTPKRQKETKKKLLTALETYREWLLQLTILDPACGSGAFLNQALDFLIKEHRFIDELQTNVLGGGLVFPNIENTVLENNIFGVDLNEESVEIAKLSLWLRTAQPRRKLNSLNNNIKCGNSLIDSKTVAGDKAFHWETEFPQVFIEKNKKIYHITTAIHDSRTSARMEKYKVREHRDMGTNPYPNIVYFTPEDDLLITQTIANIVAEDGLELLSYNICADHIHLLLACELEEIPAIMQKIKGRTSYIVGRNKKEKNKEDNKIFDKEDNKGFKPLVEKEKAEAETKIATKNKPLWQQKYSAPKEVTTQEQLQNTLNYITKNRTKHQLPPHNKTVQQLIENMCCTTNTAFKPSYKGGFDVIIGNPPYVHLEAIKNESEKLSKLDFITFDKRGDLYQLFVEKGTKLLKNKGVISYIMPNKWLQAGYGKNLREYFLSKQLIQLIDFGDLQIFEGATTYPCIFIAKNDEPTSNFSVSVLKSTNSFDFETLVSSSSETFEASEFSGETWVISSKKEKELLSRLKNKYESLSATINNNANYGIKSGLTEAFIFDEKTKKSIINEDPISLEIIHPILRGRDIQPWYGEHKNYYMLCTFPALKINIDDYIGAKNHLLSFGKKRLEQSGDKGSRKKTNNKWFETQDSIVYHNDFKTGKIMYQKFQVKPCFIYDESGLFCNDSMWIIPTENKALLGVLNSKMGWWLITKYCTQIQNGCQLIWKYFGQIPIPELTNPNLLNCTEQMLVLQEKQQSVLNKFTKYLQSQFPIEKLSKKLQNWHELAFGDFIKELNKAIKKENKQRDNNGLQPIAIPTKTEEMDWMDVFETKKAEAQALQLAINKTDKEIDQMVYELYELTEEEIKIVEAS